MLKKAFVLLMVVSMFFQFFSQYPMNVEGATTGTTYYVSYSRGNDTSAGTTEGTAWKTLSKVSSVTFNPGDTIKLKCGDIWTNDELVLKGDGTLADRITVTSYGIGNMPLINNPSADYDATFTPNIAPDARDHIHVGIKMKESVYWAIDGIEINNAEYGILAYNSTKSPLIPVIINNCVLHDIVGGRLFTLNDSQMPFLYKSIGIIAYGLSPKITNCNIQRTSLSMKIASCHDIVIDNCYIYDCSTEGMSITATKGGVISNTKILHTGYPSGVFHGVAGLLFGSCNSVTIRDSEVGDVYAAGGYDGVGIDYEGDNINITTQRTKIYDCDSSAFLVYIGAGVSNSMSRIIDNAVYNCGRVGTEPAFLRHYVNTLSYGVIEGNNIKKYTATQKLNYIDGTLTDSMPSNYKLNENTIYSYTTTMPSVQTATANSWTASTDFSRTKGANQWYYQQWDGSSYSDMTYDSENARWVGTQTNALIGSDWQHPESSLDSVRTWVAPKAGVISISATAKMGIIGGDGVMVTIKKNDTAIFPQAFIAGTNITGISTNVSGITVDAGDAIKFIVSKNNIVYNDTALWDPTITMVEKTSWNAQADFTDGQGINQWYYTDLVSTSTTLQEAMHYDSINSRWTGQGTHSLIGSNWQHPESLYNSSRRWVAPKDGIVLVTGTAKLSELGGDGVKVSIIKDGENLFGDEPYFPETLVTTTTGISTNVKIPVLAGDIISFVVNKNGDNLSDSTLWDPSLTYETPETLWSQNEQSMSSTSVAQKIDGVQMTIKGYGIGENNYVDWQGDADGIGAGLIDWSKPVDFALTINSLNFGADPYAVDWRHIWTGFISLGGGKFFSLNIAATAPSLVQTGNTIFFGTPTGNAGWYQTNRTFANTTYFWHIDLKNHKIEVATSDSYNNKPQTMTNIFTEKFDQLPTNDSDYAGQFLGRTSIPKTTHEMVYTMHEFQGTQMIPTAIVAKVGDGGTILNSEITFNAHGQSLKISDLLNAFTITGGTAKVLSGITELAYSNSLIENFLIEIDNGIFRSKYSVIVDNIPPDASVNDGQVYFLQNENLYVGFNKGTATLNGNAFASGGNIKATGDYNLVISESIENTRKISFSVVFFGDVDGDATISINDLVLVKKHLLKSSHLTGVYKVAASLSENGVVTISDLLAIKKYILNITTNLIDT